MKIFAFSKTGMVRILAISLVLSVYISAIILNYASREITAGNFFASLVFITALTAFYLFSGLKKHPPLFWGARGWLIVSFVMNFVGVMFSAAETDLENFIGYILGYGVMLFVSPFYGFGYIFESSAAVSVIGMIVCAVIFFTPSFAERAARRRRLKRKYK